MPTIAPVARSPKPAAEAAHSAAPRPAAEAQQVVDVLRSMYRVPGLEVAVRQGGQPVYDLASGAAELAGDGTAARRLQAGDTFDIGSVSKTITAAAVLGLAGKGKLSLDDPLARWHPEFPAADKITVRMLLDQTSGVADYDETPAFLDALAHHPADPWTPGRAIEEAAHAKPTNAPGAQFRYSNTNYQLLSDIAERVTGDPLEKIIDDEVAKPAGIAGQLQLPSAEGAFPATAHPLHFVDTRWQDITDTHYRPDSLLRSVMRGDGAVVTSTAALATAGEAILAPDGAVLSAQQRREMQKTADRNGYGFGIMSGELATPSGIDTPIYWHNGAVNGYRTLLAYAPKTGTTIAITMNGTPVEEAPFTHVASLMLDLAQGHSIPPEAFD